MACINNSYEAKNMAATTQCSNNVLALSVEQFNKYVNNDMKHNYISLLPLILEIYSRLLVIMGGLG